MFSPIERMIAGRYLRPRKGEGFIFLVALISLIGIGLGVAALIAVMSVMNGFRAELFDRILGVNGHAVVQGYDGRLEDWQQLTDVIRTSPLVTSATPLIEQPLMATRNNRVEGAIVRGVRRGDLLENELITQNIQQGSLDQFQDGERVIAIGSRLAFQLGARVGDNVSLVLPQGRTTPFGTAPRIVSFEVISIFEVGIYDYDIAFVMMPMATAQSFFNLGDDVGAIEVRATDPDEIDRLVVSLIPAVQSKGVIRDWRSLNRSLFEALEVERVVMFWILSIIILVAVFNIVSSLIMLVRAKTKDIAILRTMGASRAAVMRIFVLAGSLIGVAGVVAGTALGLLLVQFRQPIVTGVAKLTGADLWNPQIRFLSEMPAQTDPMETLATVTIALVLTFLATLYPSWKAADTDPVKVLRYE